WADRAALTALEAVAQLVRCERARAELLRRRQTLAHGAQHHLGRVGERAQNLRPLDEHLRRHGRCEHAELRLLVALLAQERVRFLDEKAHPASFSRTSSLTTFGFALPFVSFITCPTKNPSRPSLPAR